MRINFFSFSLAVVLAISLLGKTTTWNDSDKATSTEAYHTETAENPIAQAQALDFDGVNDFNEIFTYLTDPLNNDSDFDLLGDYFEINLGRKK